MEVIRVKNVHQALPKALSLLNQKGIVRKSRNGLVMKFVEPVTTVYKKPLERVIFHPERDANPFFHFFESLWMLEGRQDVAFVNQFVGRMEEYSDDGEVFHAAYGHRWREHFGFDQLQKVIEALRENPDDRRVVLSMWDAPSDLGKEGKDFPCNLQAIFSINENGELDMLVTNRSNDIVWGCYGANAVHFSFLMEFIAISVGVPVGTYRQVSNNLHAYLDTLEKVKDIEYGYDPYTVKNFNHVPLMSISPAGWNHDLNLFMNYGAVKGLHDPFFITVATPMWNCYQHFKNNKGKEDRFKICYEIIDQCEDGAWRTACTEWLQRREEKVNAKNS